MTINDSICYDRYTLEGFNISSDVYDCARRINALFMQETNDWICPVLLHAFVPYCLTLTKGGRFTWMRNRNKVVVQCPRVNNPCVTELECIHTRGMRRKIRARILEIDPKCNIKLKKNQSIILDDIFSEKSCLLGFDNVFPYVEHIRKRGSKEISFSCSCQNKRSIINLKPKNQ